MNHTVAIAAASTVFRVRVAFVVEVLVAAFDVAVGDARTAPGNDTCGIEGRSRTDNYIIEERYSQVPVSPKHPQRPSLHSRPSGPTGRFFALRFPPPTVMLGVAMGC